MTDIRKRAVRLIYPTLWSGVSFGALLAGCTQPQHVAPTPQTATTAPTDPAAEVANRVRDLSRQSEDFDVLSHQLPGKNTDEHRALMVKVFTQLQQILPLLHGPAPSLVFRQQLMIIDTSRAQLSGAPADMVIDPTVDTGLRATYNALLGISQHPSLDAAALDGPLGQLKGKLDELDTTRGLVHQVVAAEAVELTSGVITKMSDMFTAQLAPDSSSQPSSQPGVSPSTEPAPATTEPAPTTVPDSITPSTEPAPATAPAPTPETPASAPATDPTAAPATESAPAPATDPAATPATDPSPAPVPAPDANK